MAAKIEWHGDELVLGGSEGWILGFVRREFGYWRAIPNRNAGQRANYERKKDAQHDLETEVRRLLKAAGVEVE